MFDLNGVRAGIAVCYDSEFPLPVRAQREAGARLLLVPSCTDTRAGATRVRVGCMARALENRMFVAQAVTTGAADWSPALDTNTGEATIYAPMDRGFPEMAFSRLLAARRHGRSVILTLKHSNETKNRPRLRSIVTGTDRCCLHCGKLDTRVIRSPSRSHLDSFNSMSRLR